MRRGVVKRVVVMIPMEIKLQQDGERVIAVLPGWLLPINTFVEANSEEEAVMSLQDEMRKYWGLYV